jgi:hypothetical protein
MYFSWTSSSGASGTFRYYPGYAGFAVPDEGNGGMSRRLVLGPGIADCVPFPATTNNNRGQEAGVPYDRNVFVAVITPLARPCKWAQFTGEFGPDGKNNADIAGFLWMWSPVDGENSVKEDEAPDTFFGQRDSPNVMSYPTAAIARAPGPIGAGTMMTEIFNGNRVDLLWPGTGPMTDMTERAAVKDLMQNIDYNFTDLYLYSGHSHSLIMPDEFVMDDSIDPCSNNGQGKRVVGVTCIGGHVVSLYFSIMLRMAWTGLPASISGLTKLRHIYVGANRQNEFIIPCEFGQLADVVALIYGSSPSADCASTAVNDPITQDSVGPGYGMCGIVFPDDDSCMNGLVSMEELMIGGHRMNRFPASFFSLSTMQKISLNKAPVRSLPATMPPNLRSLTLSGVGASGPLPSFRNSDKLEEVSLDRNNFTLGDADAFDHCPNLRTLDVSYNSISAAVFHFVNSTNVETIDLAHNSIHGGVPPEWGELQSCTTVKVSHNVIEEPISAFVRMSALAFVDVSHNRIRWGSAVPGEDVTEANLNMQYWQNWNFANMPGSIVKFIASYNLLRQPPKDRETWTNEEYVGGGENGKRPNEAEVDLSHNFLWGYVNLGGNLGGMQYNFDLSYNNMSMLSGATAGCCVSTNQRVMYAVDIRNQMSPMLLSNGIQAFNSIDDALNSSMVMRVGELMPRLNSFEQVELPAGTGRFPFVCPAWLVASFISFDHSLIYAICTCTQEVQVESQTQLLYGPRSLR